VCVLRAFPRLREGFDHERHLFYLALISSLSLSFYLPRSTFHRQAASSLKLVSGRMHRCDALANVLVLLAEHLRDSTWNRSKKISPKHVSCAWNPVIWHISIVTGMGAVHPIPLGPSIFTSFERNHLHS
jgi:hypothetical protein